MKLTNRFHAEKLLRRNLANTVIDRSLVRQLIQDPNTQDHHE